MDLRSSAQDVHRCEICETAKVHSYCDFCHVNLCKQCIGEHISNGYEKHKIVPFQDRKSTLMYPKCATHPHKNCDLQCNNCNIFICTSCVGSKVHKGHDIWELDDIYKEKKENIKVDAEELNNLISPTYEGIAQDLENQIANLDKGYQTITNQISKLEEEWHKEINVVFIKMKTEIDDIKIKHRDILQKHLEEIKQIQSLIEQTAQSLKEIEESNEVSMIIEYSSKIKEFSKLPPKVEISLPTFIPNTIDRERLNSFVGQITPLSTVAVENVLSLNQSNTSVKELLDEPEIVTTIHTKFNELFNVTCVNKENIWTSGETDDIRCFNTKGLLLHAFKTTSGNWPNDITVDSDGDILYCDWSTKTIHEVKNEQTEELIRLQGWMPCQLCVTFTNDLLVTMYSDDYTQSKVVRYSGSTEKQTIQFDDEGKPLYSANVYMKYITENRNHDICVADCGAGAVVVVNQDGELRWRHTGHPSTTKYKSFIPWGITTDSQSRILTADGDNHCITVLDHNGQFLCYIDSCDFNFPWGLCVDNDDNLFVCESVRGNVKKIKYSK